MRRRVLAAAVAVVVVVVSAALVAYPFLTNGGQRSSHMLTTPGCSGPTDLSTSSNAPATSTGFVESQQSAAGLNYGAGSTTFSEYWGAWNFSAALSSTGIVEGQNTTASFNLTNISGQTQEVDVTNPFVIPMMYSQNGTLVSIGPLPAGSNEMENVTSGQAFALSVPLATDNLAPGQSYVLSMEPGIRSANLSVDIGQFLQANATIVVAPGPRATPGGSSQMTVGDPADYYATESSENSRGSILLYQVFPITVYAPTATPMNLSLQDVPSEVWTHLNTSSLVAAPSGATAMLTIMGTSTNGSADLVVKGSSQRAAVREVLNFTPTVPTIVATSPRSQFLPSSSLGAAGGGADIVYSGAIVYDPSTAGSPSVLDANFAVLGLSVNGSIEGVPSWLSVSFSSANLTLSEYQPTYLSIHVSNTLDFPSLAEPPLKCVLAVGETINGVESTQLIALAIYPPVRL